MALSQLKIGGVIERQPVLASQTKHCFFVFRRANLNGEPGKTVKKAGRVRDGDSIPSLIDNKQVANLIPLDARHPCAVHIETGIG